MEQLDLSKGTIWKTLLRYSLPLAIASLLQSTYSITDLILVGRFLGESAISAVNNAGQILLICTQIIIGITIGGNILIGQFYGAKNEKGRRETNVTLFTMSILAGICTIILLLFTGRNMLIALDAPVLEPAWLYLKIGCFGLLPVFMYNALSAMMRGVGNSKQPLYFVGLSSLLNIVFDIVFLGYFGWGVTGVAWATVMAQTVSFIMSIIYILKHKDVYFLSLDNLYIKKEKLKTMLQLGIPTAVQMTIVGLSWVFMLYLINDYGVEASAASAIVVRIKDFALLFTLAMSTATSTMVSHCLGAGDFDRAKHSVYVAMGITVAVAIVIVVGVEVTAPYLVSIFKTDLHTAQLAILNLRIEIIAQIFFASFMIYHSLAIGAGHTMFVLFSSVTNSILVRVILAVIFEKSFGLVGIYWACMIGPAASIPLGYFYVKSNIWRRSLVLSHENA